MSNVYFMWISEVCKLLGKSNLYGAELIKDPSWHACFDDGLTPEVAVREYRAAHPEGLPDE